MHDEPRSDLERKALAAWTVQEPPPGFADRVLAADARPKQEPIVEVPELARLGWRWPGVAAAAIVAAALVGSIAAAVQWWPGGAQEQRLTPAAETEGDDGPAIGAALPEAPKPAQTPADVAAKIDAYLGGFGRR